jgi:hypothetical protein
LASAGRIKKSQRAAEASFSGVSEITWNWPRKGEGEGLMGNSQGRDNVRKRAARRKKTERLALAKTNASKKAKK